MERVDPRRSNGGHGLLPPSHLTPLAIHEVTEIFQDKSFKSGKKLERLKHQITIEPSEESKTIQM